VTPSASGSRVAGKLGLTDRTFAGPRSRKLKAAVTDGLLEVDRVLADELHMTDQIADAASRYLYEAGGKRVRPMLALITAQLGDGANENVILGATALEMTHLGTLYHDDVMDAADKRRGVPSAHAVWGNSVAILTGDLLFSRASQIMARQGDRAIRLQADTFERLVLGQMHETVGPQDGEDRVAFNGLYRFYNDRILPTVAKAVSSNAEAYDYLNESIKDWPDQRTLSAWIRGAGWTDVAYRNLSFGIVALHRARKPSR